MESIDLNDFYSGGYFLLRANKPDWPQLQTGLLPEKLVSLSDCICPRISVYWGWQPGNRNAALEFGIPDNKFDEFVEWCGIEYQNDMDFPSMFYSPDAARRFIERFLPNINDLFLIGAGLHKPLEESGWREISDGELIGIEKRIEQHLPLESGGTVLGFEVVSFSYRDLSHSWICSDLHKEMNNLYGIRPGQYGLIETLKEASQVYEWIAEDNMQGKRAEPEPYDYWLLVSYPLTDS